MSQRKMKMSDRLDCVREAVAEATTGLEGKEYREFMEALISDADGWRMELEESDGEEEEEE